VEVFGVPFEATASFRPGSSKAPEGVLEASVQIDLFDLETRTAWQEGIAMHPVDKRIYEWNKAATELRQQSELATDEERACLIEGVTEYSERVNEVVYKSTLSSLKAGKIPGIIGGEHSIAYGAITAAAESCPGLGVLQLDAHADMRCAYEGLTHSHASIFYNVMSNTAAPVDTLVQVGLRDVGITEIEFAEACGERVRWWTDFQLQAEMDSGRQWAAVVQDIIEPLPQQVWLSFDVDGLDPTLCPNTGTPVPGGLNWHQALQLIKGVAKSGRTIVGFDLCEVGDGEWDNIVGARLLYKLATWSIITHPKFPRIAF
jgi:agmatinase